MRQTEWKRIFGDNLVGILEEKGMSQRQLARDSGVSVSMINDYINGQRIPSVIAAINMAYALDMEVSELVDFDERVEM
jgi:transcriptional regulator with XRE-family HTH domain